MKKNKVMSIVGTQAHVKRIKFARKPDLDSWIRLKLASIMNSRGFDDWGLVSDLAIKFGVSRQFLYDNLNYFSDLLSVEGVPSLTIDDEWIHRLILCLRLHCTSSIDGIVETLNEMGLKPSSAGHVSEFLKNIGTTCEIEIPCVVEPVVLLLDETFTKNRPILVIMEASSHYILAITLAPDRKSATWEIEVQRLQKLGVNISLLVKDQGASLKSMAKNLVLPERVDLFHLLKPFDPFLSSLMSRAYGAIEEELKKQRVFDNRKTEEALVKFLEKYENAVIKMEQAVCDYDDYEFIHNCLHESFDSFTSNGGLRTREMAEGDINATLSLMEEQFGNNGKIMAAVKFLRKNLDDYWSYFDQLEDMIRQYAKKIPEHTLQAVCFAWQLSKKSIAVKKSSQKKDLDQQSKEWIKLAMTGADDKLSANIEELLAELDANVRSSSPLEAVNSVIRNSLNSCRGQVTQEALTMLACHINNKRATRGKYAGTSPYERLTGKVANESSIRQLMRLSTRDDKSNSGTVKRTTVASGRIAA